MHRDLFEERLRILLPETYEVFDDAVQPRSMGSAGLKYGADGRVLWNEMWGSFCDLAMAGGPPHRGTLLEPFRGTFRGPEQMQSMQAASAEICRGIGLVTGLCAEPAGTRGWLRMYCTSAAMAGWLARAIAMENVSAIAQGLSLFLPTGPDFRVVKEVKNVITSVAKSCHYWQDHMPEAKRDAIAGLLAAMDREAPLLQPALGAMDRPEELRRNIAKAIERSLGRKAVSLPHVYTDWIGIECGRVAAAIWIMRACAAGNIAARREGTIVFLPMNPAVDATGERTAQGVLAAWELGRAYGIGD